MSSGDADVMSFGFQQLEKMLNAPLQRKDLWPAEAVAMFFLPDRPVTIQEMVWKPGILCRQIVIHDARTQAPCMAAVMHLPFNEAGFDYHTGISINEYYVIWSPGRGRAYFSTTPPKDMTGVCARKWVEVKIEEAPEVDSSSHH